MSSDSGTGSGQLALTSGLGPAAGNGLVGEAQPSSRQLAISVDSVGADLTFSLLADGHVAGLQLGDRRSCALFRGLPRLLHCLGARGLRRIALVLARRAPVLVCAADRSGPEDCGAGDDPAVHANPSSAFSYSAGHVLG